MKKSIFTLIALGVATLLFSAAAQMPAAVPPDAGNSTNAAPDQSVPPPEMDTGNGGPPDAGGPPPDMGGDQTQGETPGAPTAAAGRSESGATTILPTRMIGAGNGTLTPSFAPPATGTNSDAIRLNFRNAPLDEVLSYLSDAAGFIIVLDTPVHGNVSVISGQPMTKDEAVDLLNSVLNQNGYAAVRDGRTLTIMNKTDAMRSDIPVKVSSDPDAIPKNDEIVTQIIPVRFVSAGDLVKDLSSFVSPQATVVANDAGNSIVITDTQSNIRHLVKIIRAIDDSAEATTEIRVFQLKYANPSDVASELSSVFPNSSSGGTQAPMQFRGGGGPGGFFARMMAANAGGDNSSSDRIKKATQVTVVADARIQAVIVTAPNDLMDQIASMMKDLDVPSDRDQNVYVFQMKNGDPQQAVQVLQNMFQSSSSRGSTSSSTTSPLMQRSQNNTTTSGTTSTTTSGIGGGTGGIGGGGGGGRTF
jgi:general secretion pathway protein D